MPDEILVPSRWRDRVASLAGRRRESWMLAGVVVGLLIGTFVVVGRSAPALVAPPAQVTQPEPNASPTQADASLAVHVAGSVRNPGLYELPEDLRVADAIDAAGGATRRADLDALNLAEPLVDGVKVYVPRRGEPVAATGMGTGQSPEQSTTGGALISINTADGLALEQIPGIGPVKAAAIVDYRTQIGSFESIDQLLDVTGIGPATLENLRPYVTL
jgi:competence protein ComEA